MNGYMTTQEAAEKWGITNRQVQILCKENRVVGATRMSRIWVIPVGFRAKDELKLGDKEE